MIELLLLLNVCHWVGDYTHASRPWMLAAKKFGRPLAPIAAHALVHAWLVTAVCLFAVDAKAGWIAFYIMLPTHFAIDVLKGRINEWVPAVQNPSGYWHWWVFGADQFAHQAVIILIAYVVTP